MERKLRRISRPVRIDLYTRRGPDLAISPLPRNTPSISLPTVATIDDNHKQVRDSPLQDSTQPRPESDFHPLTNRSLARSYSAQKYSDSVRPLRHGTFFDLKPSVQANRRLISAKPEGNKTYKKEVMISVVGSKRGEKVELGSTTHTEHKKSDYLKGAGVRPHSRLNISLKSKKALVLQSMALLLFVFGMYVVIDGWRVNSAARTQVEVLAAKAENDESSTGGGREVLSEKKPEGVSTYQVAPDLPRTLSITALNVKSRILHVGVKLDNSLVAPNNIFDTGWYNGSARPTDSRGAMLIDGHVSGPTQHGVFYNIKSLNKGDELIVEKGDLKKVVFIVEKIEIVKSDEVDMFQMLRSVDGSRLGLNLITCGGRFDVSSNKYESRVLVFAVQR